MAVLGTDRVKTGFETDSRRFRQFRGLVCCACGMVLFMFITFQSRCDVRPMDKSPLEYRVKAAFLLNFAKFVEWPKKSFDNKKSPIIIGVLGKDPFGPLLESTVHGKTVRKRSIIVKRFKDIKTLQPCHILFVSSSESKRLSKVFTALKDVSALTVGETKRFARDGGILRFTMVAKKVRFEINADAAKRSKLKISSKLLQLADIVRDIPDKRNP